MIRSMVFAVGFSLCIASAAGAQDAAVAKGMALFAEQKCSMCHSIGEKGNKKGPLDEVGSLLMPDEIRHWLVNPKEMAAKTKAERTPPMKEFNLPKKDVDALVAYLQTLKKKA
jgi:mono/diheme cytochrome c family protein